MLENVRDKMLRGALRLRLAAARWLRAGCAAALVALRQ